MLLKVFEEIKTNYKFYYSIAFRHMRNYEDARDVMQNVCLRISTKKPELLPNKNMKAWIAIICCNESKNMITYKKRLSQSDALLLNNQDECSNYGNPQDLEFFYDDICFAAIQTAPEQYRSALYEHFKDSSRILHVAKKYNIPEANLRYWRKKIAKLIKEFL